MLKGAQKCAKLLTNQQNVNHFLGLLAYIEHPLLRTSRKVNALWAVGKNLADHQAYLLSKVWKDGSVRSALQTVKYRHEIYLQTVNIAVRSILKTVKFCCEIYSDDSVNLAIYGICQQIGNLAMVKQKDRNFKYPIF